VGGGVGGVLSGVRERPHVSPKTRDMGHPDRFFVERRLFQFYEEQDEDGPDSDGQGKLDQGGVAERASSGQSVGEQHHGKSGQHCDYNFRFRIHFRSPPHSSLVCQLLQWQWAAAACESAAIVHPWLTPKRAQSSVGG
jgi:hypothetical protein